MEKKIYEVQVNITISGRIEIEAETKTDAKEKIEKFLKEHPYRDIEHNIKGRSQVNQVPISWISIKK